MDQCKLVYNGDSLTDKQKTLKDVIKIKDSDNNQTVYQMEVRKKGETDEILDLIGKFKRTAESNPLIMAGVIVALVFFVLFVMGQASA